MHYLFFLLPLTPQMTFRPNVQTPQMQILALHDPINLDLSAVIPGEIQCVHHDALLPVQLDCLMISTSSTAELKCYRQVTHSYFSKLMHSSPLWNWWASTHCLMAQKDHQLHLSTAQEHEYDLSCCLEMISCSNPQPTWNRTLVP